MTTPPSSPKPWRGLLLLAFVFLLGAGCGVGGGLLVLRGLAQRAIKGDLRDNGPAAMLTSVLEKQIASDLDLTPAEQAAAHRELQVTLSQIRDLRLRLRSDAQAVVADTLTRIEPHLPPEKRHLLRQRVKERFGDWGLVP